MPRLFHRIDKVEIYMKETASLNNIFLSEASPMCFVLYMDSKENRTEMRKIAERLNGYELNINIFMLYERQRM